MRSVMMDIKQVLYYDIETAPYYDDRADANKDKLRFVGFRLPSGQKVIYEHPQQREAIQNTLSSYRYLAGHNIETRTYNGMEYGYDNKVMTRHGYKLKNRDGSKIIFFDTQKILEKRAGSMMYIKLGQGQYNLRYLTEYFNLVDDSTRKGDFNYYLLRKPFLLPQERKDLVEYLQRDLESGFLLFQYLYNNFSGILPRLSPINQINGQWLNGATGTTGYRWFCNVTGKLEVYDWDAKRDTFQAGFMYVDKDRDMAKNVLVFDFASLYPTMMRGNNLYSRVPSEHVDKDRMIDRRNGREVWHGSEEVFPTYEQNKHNGIVGYYYKDEVGLFEKALEDAFNERKIAKKKFKETGDKKYFYEQQGIKILMNASYGASGSAPFSSMYDRTTAEDITRSAQCCIRHAKKVMEDNGYWIIYLHTDSLYVVDVYNNHDKLKQLARDITETQRKALNIPTAMHNFEFEKHYDKLWLTKGDDGENLKQRNFTLVDDKVSFTGGKLGAFSTSELSKKIFREVISKDLINGKRDLYYKPEELIRIVKEYGKAYPELLQIRKKVKLLTSYKSLTSQPAKISAMYGSGEHYLVPNKYVGVSSYKGKKWLGKMEELKKIGGLDWLSMVDFSKFVEELSVFVRPEDRKKLKKLVI